MLHKEKGVGIINAGCVGMRLLSNCGPPSWHPAPKEIKDRCHAAAVYCQVTFRNIQIIFSVYHHFVKSRMLYESGLEIKMKTTSIARKLIMLFFIDR